MAGNPSNTDVLIIGAGPSGTSAAIWCAMHNLSVTIIEWKEFPRHKPGETLHPGLSVLFTQLDVKNAVENKSGIRYNGYFSILDNETVFIPFAHQTGKAAHGYQILRSDLDDILLQKAIEVGVNVVQPCKALSIIAENNVVIGIRTTHGNFFSKFCIDAAGSSHWLANQLKLEIRKYSRPLTVRYGYAKGVIDNNKFSEPVFSFQKNGWTWCAKIGSDLYHWSRLTTSGTIASNKQMPEEFSTLEAIAIVRGADVTWRKANVCAGQGYFLAGDAAMVFDPSSSKGVLRGIYSGIMAAHCILKTHTEQLSEQSMIMSFNKWMENWFNHDLKIMKGFYQSQNISLESEWS